MAIEGDVPTARCPVGCVGTDHCLCGQLSLFTPLEAQLSTFLTMRAQDSTQGWVQDDLGQWHFPTVSTAPTTTVAFDQGSSTQQ